MISRSPHYRRNFVAIWGDSVSFGLALTFAGLTTTLPDFVSQLTDSQVVVGLLSTVSNGAWLLPQLFYARFLSSKRRKKGYVTMGALLGRPLYLLYAAALWLGLYRNPPLALILLFAAQVLFLGSDAMAAVAWFDIFAKAIPEERRGRLIGIAQVARGMLAIGAGVIISALLGEQGPAFPLNYAVIFALAGTCLLLSLFSWSFVAEPDEPVEEQPLSWREYLPQLLGTMRQDRAFRWVLSVRLLAGFEGLALNFYILFATQELGLGRETVGLFTAVQTAGGILASLGLSAIGERWGNRRVIQTATALSLTAPLGALGLFFSGAHGSLVTTVLFAWIFFVIGVSLGSTMLGYYNYILDLAPPGRRPTYIGLFNTIGGLLIIPPTLGGWLLRETSYGVLFALTAACVILGHGLSWGLPVSRRNHAVNAFTSEEAHHDAGDLSLR